MLGKNLSLHFYPKKPKNYESGPVPIYLRITIEGEVIELCTSRKCELTTWDKRSEKVLGKNEAAKELNHYISTYRMKVFEARLLLIEQTKPVTAAAIKSLLTGREEKSKQILEIFKLHNEKMAALVGKEDSPGTMERYRTSLGHTRSFIQWKYNMDDMSIQKLDFEFVSDYEFWLKSVRNCNHNTSIRYISKKVKLLFSRHSVEIYYNYQRIALHSRVRIAYTYTTDKEHLASTHRFVAEWTPQKFLSWADNIHPDVKLYIQEVLQRKQHPEQA